jgi:hypothetical protein
LITARKCHSIAAQLLAAVSTRANEKGYLAAQQSQASQPYHFHGIDSGCAPSNSSFSDTGVTDVWWDDAFIQGLLEPNSIWNLDVGNFLASSEQV